MLLLVAAALPSLFWDGGTETAGSLKEAQVSHFVAPPGRVESWKAIPGISVEAGDPSTAIKLVKPAVNYRMDEASASSAPWVDSNGWRFLRQPAARFFYDVPGPAAALAAAEAYTYGAEVMIRTDAKGLKPLGEVLDFLEGLGGADLPALANIGYIDDGSAQSGELMNLMVRRNLLFCLVSAPDPRLDLTVHFGSGDYSSTGKDPYLLSQKIRSQLTDDKRLVRIFGSEVVIARLTGSDGHVRLHLLNYAATGRRVQGVHVSVLGNYPKHKVSAFRIPNATLLDYTVDEGRTEFTIPDLREYVVVDLYQ